LPLLRERATDPQFDIADAALVALDDLGTPEALAALQEVADDEERPPLVRARAKMLLEARAKSSEIEVTR
jgi:HEAT repeat protein